MTQQSMAMRIMAEKYEQLAQTTPDPAERQRFGEYVKLYREMELHFVQTEQPEDRGGDR